VKNVEWLSCFDICVGYLRFFINDLCFISSISHLIVSDCETLAFIMICISDIFSTLLLSNPICVVRILLILAVSAEKDRPHRRNMSKEWFSLLVLEGKSERQ
jgi:hypothetical protein